MISRAQKFLDVKEDILGFFFQVQDPYNPNTLEGYLCRQGDYRYGALVITKVNDTPTEQPVVKGSNPFGQPE